MTTNPASADGDRGGGAFQTRRLVGELRQIGEWSHAHTGIALPEELQDLDVFEYPRGTVSCRASWATGGPVAPRLGRLPRIGLDLTPDRTSMYTPAPIRCSYACSASADGSASPFAASLSPCHPPSPIGICSDTPGTH